MRRLPVAVVALLAAAGCAGASASAGGFTVLAAGSRPAAPPVAGPTVTGGRLDLAALRGHVVVLNFWGSWCAPCRDEAAGLQGAFAAFRSAGVDFVGVDERDDPANAVAFLRSEGVRYPSLSDPAGQILVRFRSLPPTAIPSTLVVDRRGRLAARLIGPASYTQLTAVLHRLVGRT